jgi:hypothetical protein
MRLLSNSIANNMAADGSGDRATETNVGSDVIVASREYDVTHSEITLHALKERLVHSLACSLYTYVIYEVAGNIGKLRQL